MASALKYYLNVLNCKVLGTCRNNSQHWGRFIGKTRASLLPEFGDKLLVVDRCLIIS